MGHYLAVRRENPSAGRVLKLSLSNARIRSRPRRNINLVDLRDRRILEGSGLASLQIVGSHQRPPIQLYMQLNPCYLIRSEMLVRLQQLHLNCDGSCRRSRLDF